MLLSEPFVSKPFNRSTRIFALFPFHGQASIVFSSPNCLGFMATSECHTQLGQQQHQHQLGSTQGRDSQQSCLSFRKRRRIEQSQRQASSQGTRTRGQTRALKWNDERTRRLGVNPTLTINADMRRIVGNNSDQFITEASSLVRTMLPLDCRRWKEMSSDKKQRLLAMIKAKWNMPEGVHVTKTVESHCQSLYRHYRYRLKEKYFDGYTIAEAIKNRPENIKLEEWEWLVQRYWGTERQKRISNGNRTNRKTQKVPGLQGSKSTARILDMMRKDPHPGNSSQPSEQANTNTENGLEASAGATEGSTASLPPPEPEYIRLWEKTKRHKDNSWDPVAKQKLQEFKDLHKQQLELHGVDNLTVQEAYMKVLGTTSGYINGFGFGPKPLKRTTEDRSNGGGIEIAHQMSLQMEQMERSSREREAAIKEQIEKESREREARLKEQLEKELKEREAGLKVEIQGLKEDKVQMMEKFEKMKKEAEEKEAKMNADIQAMQEKLSALFAMNLHKGCAEETSCVGLLVCLAFKVI